MEAVDRRKSREVQIGSLKLGGDHPIVVQSMTTTRTEDIDATLAEIHELEEAGVEMVRVAVPFEKSARALSILKREMKVPLIADIHFDSKMAILSLEAGVDKIRLNPGNINKRKRVERIVAMAKERGTPIRIGVNSGSVEKEFLEKHGSPTPAAMVDSAAKHVSILEEMGFEEIVISLKSTDTLAAVRAYRLAAGRFPYPLHLGITEAGKPGYGEIKSAAGLGSLLLDGIGDTIRVSLSGPSKLEVDAAFQILKATGRRVLDPEVVACPTCGRIEIDLFSLVEEVEAFAKTLGQTPIKITVLGCAVNGPGEAREADIGVAGGRGLGFIYRRGEQIRRVPESELLQAMKEEVAHFLKEEEEAAKAASS
ncbi:MAG: 4-hydroxy-3-methylbut-2-en-1-yl diphosphate synthase [Planctomycetota bacterium]|nr:MAG: 4-hydroxy-3-methylbut-2-en-1-yl diphosphate synthase [Planctomycetota bacterium]